MDGRSAVGGAGDGRGLEHDEIEAAAARDLRARASSPGLLILVALGWVGAVGYALALAWPGPSLQAWIGWAATVSAPLILIGLVWLIFGRTSRRETRRFTEAVAAMRAESRPLESDARRRWRRGSQDNRAALREEAARLMSLGDEASDRLGRVTHFSPRETAELDRKAQALDNAAATARVDIGVLLNDLPRAEEQARAVADAMKQAGLAAHEQAGALEGQLAALTARGPRGGRGRRRRGAAARRPYRPDRERRRRRGRADGRCRGADESGGRRRDGARRRIGRSGPRRPRSAGPGDAGDDRAEPGRVRGGRRRSHARPRRAARHWPAAR